MAADHSTCQGDYSLPFQQSHSVPQAAQHAAVFNWIVPLLVRLWCVHHCTQLPGNAQHQVHQMLHYITYHCRYEALIREVLLGQHFPGIFFGSSVMHFINHHFMTHDFTTAVLCKGLQVGAIVLHAVLCPAVRQRPAC